MSRTLAEAAKAVTELQAGLHAPRLARRVVRAFLPDGDLADTAELIASELTTNAVRQSVPGQPISLWLELNPGELFIGVIDSAAGTPLERHASPDDENGRGLSIVVALSTAFGCTPLPGGRKCVYCTITAETTSLTRRQVAAYWVVS